MIRLLSLFVIAREAAIAARRGDVTAAHRLVSGI
jgi:uncharacterized membrane protein